MKALAPVVLLALAVALPARAVEEEAQAWFLATARGPIAGNWRLYVEAQPRIDGDGLRQLILRPALGYQVARVWSLWQGYGWTPSFDPFTSEQRLFQQSLLEMPRGILPFAVTNRTRIEERWIENVSGVSVRARHMLRVTQPLDSGGRWALVAYDEPFATLNPTGGGPRSGFDQNRAFLGFSRALGSGTRIELGYLNQFLNAASPSPDIVRHVALVGLEHAW